MTETYKKALTLLTDNELDNDMIIEGISLITNVYMKLLSTVSSYDESSEKLLNCVKNYIDECKKIKQTKNQPMQITIIDIKMQIYSQMKYSETMKVNQQEFNKIRDLCFEYGKKILNKYYM